MLIQVVVYAENPAATITLKPSAEISGKAVSLGDIASISTNSKALGDKLKGVELCASPLPGKMRKLSRSQLAVSLRKSGIDTSIVSLICPENICITRRSVTISGQQLFDAAKECILGNSKLPGSVYVEPVRLLPAVQLPIGRVELKAQVMGSIRKGQNSVPIDIVIDGKTERRVYVPVMVKVIAKVLVASKSILKGDELTPDNTSFEDREITSLPYDPYTDELGDGYQASMSITQGSIIRNQWVKPPVMVRSGDNVIVVAGYGGVRVTDKGIAVQDGGAGDRVKVRLDAGREVRAFVVEPGVVQLGSLRRD